ncbi:S8 family serine peptidase [Verrucomicrobiaceae bacterium R5-34]|nr:S8 family serine peptidase [Verrucomicrobiaceae bacterium R5-34]
MMAKLTALALLLLTLGSASHTMAGEPTLKLPIRVHLITGVEMVREIPGPDGKPHRAVMGMPLTVESTAPIMQQVNEIWEPAGIQWVVDPAKGGGGIVAEKAGGGKLSPERLQQLAQAAAGRQRKVPGPYMTRIFPALADPAQNESIGADGTFNDAAAKMYHLYLFPYVGQTLQGTAHLPGTFAIVGVHSDKRPHKAGYPKPRPLLIAGDAKPTLSIANFPAAGALSATIAHELGHNLTLTHRDEGMKDNLMKGHVKIRLAPNQIRQARAQAMKGPLIKEEPTGSVRMESLPGDGVWVSPLPVEYQHDGSPLRATIWFDKQLLGDGQGYQRRAKEFSGAARRSLRKQVIQALKSENQRSLAAADDSLQSLLKAEVISELDPHWIVNGFTCNIRHKDIAQLKSVPGVRKIFLRVPRKVSEPQAPEQPVVPVIEAPTEPSYQQIPWYVTQLQADHVWKEFGAAGQGTLNVIHDKNFIFSDHLNRTVYRNPGETPNNGIDDDGNGYIDDVHGYNFDRQSTVLYTRPFHGNPKNRTILHGTSCATIVSGAAALSGAPQYGVAPLSRWAGVINLGGIERSVEWAIEQGADTYSMSFSRRNFGEYQSHWRKVMEHGSFCGVYFVSGAGNRKLDDPHPFLMNIPQSIPAAVFAAAGVHKDLSKTSFSCVGPVTWNTEHYQDGVVQKPEVCAFNYQVPCLFPNGETVPALLNGNSYAGPMFCGAISLMLSADPDLLPWDLQEIITSTARDVGPEGLDYETGHGLIDCYAAVKEVLRRKALR